LATPALEFRFIEPFAIITLRCTANLSRLRHFDAFKAFRRLNAVVDLIEFQCTFDVNRPFTKPIWYTRKAPKATLAAPERVTSQWLNLKNLFPA
jgi:hypothetical protein